MIKKFICLFLVFFLSVNVAVAEEDESTDNESFTSLQQGETAPYTGYLFTPESLAKIYSDIEQQEKLKQLEFETKLRALSLDISRLKEVHALEIRGRDELYTRVTTEKDKTIGNLSTKLEAQKWYTVGAFVLGIVITGGVVYYIGSAVK